MRTSTAISWLVVPAVVGLLLAPLAAFFAAGADLSRLAADPYLRSLKLGSGAAALALILGLPAGWALAGAGRGSRWMLSGALAVLLVPPYLAASVWLIFAGKLGLVGFSDRALSLVPEAMRGFLEGWNLVGAAAVLAGSLWPCVALSAAGALAAVGREEREAALLARGRWGRFVGVELPAALPAALAGAALVFALAATEVGATDLFLVNAATRDILKGFEVSHDYSASAGRALPLLVFALAGGAGLGLLLVGRVFPQMATARIAPAPAGRSPQLHAWALLAATLGAVLAGLAWNAGSPAAVARAATGESGVVLRSLGLAAGGATGALVLGAAAVWAASRARGRSGAALLAAALALLSLPLILPGTLWGIGALRLREWTGDAGAWLFDGPLMLVWSGAARGAFAAAAIIEAGRRSTASELFEAARLAGAGRVDRLWLAIRLMPGHVAAAWLVAGALALGELGAAVQIAPPGWDTLQVRVFNEMHNYHGVTTAALAFLTTAATAAVAALVALLPHRSDRSYTTHGTNDQERSRTRC